VSSFTVISISPVPMEGFTVFASRAMTLPVTVMTLS
jgi:hypothetical protein